MTDIFVFDWETTSNKPESTRGVQFAAVASTKAAGYAPLWNQICDPQVDIHHEASEVHGITREMTLGQPVDFEVAAEFIHYWDRAGRPITAGHNSLSFDIPVTRRLGKLAGCETELRGPHIDTMVLAQRLWPMAPSFRLSANEFEARKTGGIGLTQWLKLGTGEGAHDALADCVMVLKLIDRICEETGKSPAELAAWLEEPFIHEICHFGKHRGKPWGKGPGKVPVFYVKWCTENWTGATQDMRATIRHHYNLEFKRK